MAGKMKAAVWQAPRQMTIDLVPIPEVGPRDVLIKVKAVGICGSDVHSYKLGFYVQSGQILGHEFSGEIVQLGAEVDGLEVGERVTAFQIGVCGTCYWCQRQQYGLCPDLFLNSTGYGLPGAMAEYVHISGATLGINVFKLPSEIDFEIGATIEPTVTASSAANEVQPGDKVVILGAGLIGNVAMQLAKSRGASKVVVTEVSPLRLEMARRMGADAVFNPLAGDALEWVKQEIGVGRYHFNEGAMADVVLEMAGAPMTVTQSLEMVRSGGTIVYVGLPEKPALIDTTKIIHKTPKIVGCLGGSTFEIAMDLLASGKADTRPLITHRFPLDEAQAALEMQLRSEESIKVLIEM